MVRGVSRRGATKVEYALMVMLLGVSCVLVLAALGDGVSGLFEGAVSSVDPRVPTSAVGEPTGPGDNNGKNKSKSNRGRGRNPGNGNTGNDKSVGNAPNAGG